MGDETPPPPGPLRSALGVVAAMATLVVGTFAVCVVLDTFHLATFQTPARAEAFARSLEGTIATRAAERTEARQLVDAVAGGRPDVWLVGGSSLVEPRRELVDGILTGALARSGCPLEVVNLAEQGQDLGAVGVQLQRALAARGGDAPEVVVVYAGHNAYRNAYLSDHTPLGHPLRWTLAWVFAYDVVRHDLRPVEPTWQDWDALRSWQRAVRAGPALHALQAAGLWRVDAPFWDTIDRETAAAFAQRLKQARWFADAVGAAFVVEVPVGNLSTPVYGSLPDILELTMVRDGATPGRARAEAALALRDQELFTADLRAKRRVRDHVRGLADAPGVHVHDVETAFLEDGVAMDDTMFSDAFHFTEAGHRAHLERLAAFVVAEGLCPVGAGDAGMIAPSPTRP